MRVINFRGVPDELYRDLKIAAAERDITLTEALLEACKQWVQRHQRKRRRKKQR